MNSEQLNHFMLPDRVQSDYLWQQRRGFDQGFKRISITICNNTIIKTSYHFEFCKKCNGHRLIINCFENNLAAKFCIWHNAHIFKLKILETYNRYKFICHCEIWSFNNSTMANFWLRNNKKSEISKYLEINQNQMPK